MNIKDKNFKIFVDFCKNGKYDIVNDIIFNKIKDNKDAFFVEFKVNNGRKKNPIDDKSIYIIESAFWATTDSENIHYLIFKDYGVLKNGYTESFFINPKLKEKSQEKLILNFKFYQRKPKISILNKEQLLSIFNNHNQEIKNVLLKRTEFDKNLEDVFLEKNETKISILEYKI